MMLRFSSFLVCCSIGSFCFGQGETVVCSVLEEVSCPDVIEESCDANPCYFAAGQFRCTDAASADPQNPIP